MEYNKFKSSVMFQTPSAMGRGSTTINQTQPKLFNGNQAQMQAMFHQQ
jgi:hypothetical protein